MILGGPGAGKGTQAQQLCHLLLLSLVSTSDLLRQAIASKSELGLQAQFFVENGELLPDPILIEFMRQRLLQPDATGGWLLEGYPRTAFQAEELDFLLDELEQQLNWAIYLEVPESVMMSRCVEQSRTLQPIDAVKSRPDDRPEIVQRRINLFQERIPLILEYYSYRNQLLTINANQPPKQVQQDIFQKLKI